MFVLILWHMHGYLRPGERLVVSGLVILFGSLLSSMSLARPGVSLSEKEVHSLLSSMSLARPGVSL